MIFSTFILLKKFKISLTLIQFFICFIIFKIIFLPNGDVSRNNKFRNFSHTYTKLKKMYILTYRHYIEKTGGGCNRWVDFFFFIVLPVLCVRFLFFFVYSKVNTIFKITENIKKL